MLFKNITARIIIQELLLLATILVLAATLCKTHNYATIALLTCLATAQVIAIIRSITKVNRQLATFFDTVRFDDYTVSSRFVAGGRSFEELSRSLEALSQQFKVIREAKEAQFQFNQNILHNVGAGIIAFDDTGNVAFSNNLFHNMMRTPYCDNIEKLGLFNQDLLAHLRQAEAKRKQLFKVDQDGATQNFLLTSTVFIVNSRRIQLVMVQDIQPAVDQTEMEAWQKLIRVLTHEIMNSITPISSLTQTAHAMLPAGGKDHVSQETVNDLREALDTIHRRSDGLISFVQQYRALTAIPQPCLAIIPVEELFQRISTLFRASLQGTCIQLEEHIHGHGLEIIADSSLVEQVLLNVLKNAHQAVDQRAGGRISLSARENLFQKIEITVSDNGCGILPDVIDKIFIPFFTTKPAGSGIGLSLSRQIMLMHGGDISASSVTDQGSTFVLKF